MNYAELSLLDLEIYIEEEHIKTMERYASDPEANRAAKAKARYEVKKSKKKLEKLWDKHRKLIAKMSNEVNNE